MTHHSSEDVRIVLLPPVRISVMALPAGFSSASVKSKLQDMGRVPLKYILTLSLVSARKV